MKHVYKLIAPVELDLEEIIHACRNEYGEPVTADDVFEYIESNLVRLTPIRGCRGVYIASDGPSVDGFADKTYREIEKLLENS